MSNLSTINWLYRPIKALALGISLCFLNSCSRMEESPAPQEVKVAEPAPHVVNGRLVFANGQALLQLRDRVLWQKTNSELDRWEQEHQFRSLRSSAAASVSEQGAFDLMEEFMFPSSYASLINPAGEYQIGKRIYWFHKGFKYEANSEEELLLIKKSPKIAKVKYSAGARLVSSKTTNDTTTKSRSYLDSYGYTMPGDRKWVGPEFGWDGRRRRLTIETFVYAEAIPYYLSSSPSFSTFYSALVLSVYREYYRSGAWRRGSEELTISYDIIPVGSVKSSVYDIGHVGPVTSNYGSYQNLVANNVNYQGNGNYTLDLLYDTFYLTGGSIATDITFYWDYTVTGSVSVKMTPAQVTNGNPYIISGDLW